MAMRNQNWLLLSNMRMMRPLPLALGLHAPASNQPVQHPLRSLVLTMLPFLMLRIVAEPINGYKGTLAVGGNSRHCQRSSARSISRPFRGTPIKEFISDARMQRFAMMLKNGSTPIKGIAKVCGHGTEAALRTAFRKRHMMPMNEWRRLYSS